MLGQPSAPGGVEEDGRHASALGRAGAGSPLLAISGLTLEFRTGSGVTRALNGVDLRLDEHETLALVGESGSGKSITGEAIMGIVDSPPGVITGGTIRFRGENLLELDEAALNRVRGQKIAMVFQDALATLNPVLSVGSQIAEMFSRHRHYTRHQSRLAAIAVMERVQIPSAGQRFYDYPHQFSGGMRQRVMIAIAIALEPDVLIADEPTTALDVTVQAGIVELLAELCAERGMGMILITHDLSVVANAADRVAVMYAGRIVEDAPVLEIFAAPRHPYTQGLMRSTPRIDHKAGSLDVIPGSPPDPRQMPSGCPFHPRCPYARERCRREIPPLRPAGATRRSACHYWEELGHAA